MASRFTIKPPGDYELKRDFCSYGYFLLHPNFWDPRKLEFSRVLSLEGGPAQVRVGQPGGVGRGLSVVASRGLTGAEREEARAQLTRVLRLDEGTETIAAFHGLDERWRAAGRGRLMRSPTLFEDIIKTVTSCNVTWPSTVQMNRRLCEVLGDPVEAGGERQFSFPSAERIARARPQTLRARCRVGYRDARIVELARLFTPRGKRGPELEASWFEDLSNSDDAVFERLMELPGIGPYAAANIMQLLGRYGRLPLDTESVRHGKTILGYKGSSAQVMKKVHRHYAPFGAHAFRSYWFELWAFYESKHGPAWTWERDSTGKLFTAALLSK
ncbi:MAG: hypothetical protein IT436_16585 [Phycisphaerales bacterium]|nr:hypothetical protein [Phycisphaerales bacterium]